MKTDYRINAVPDTSDYDNIGTQSKCFALGTQQHCYNNIRQDRTDDWSDDQTGWKQAISLFRLSKPLHLGVKLKVSTPEMSI